MPKWENGCIYMLRHKDDVELQNVCVGSTTNFRGRKYEHKQCCNNPNKKKYNQKKYQYIRANGGWDQWKMIWLEDYPCKSKKELLKREDEVMLQYENRLNQIRAHTTHEEKKEQKKQYRQNNLYKNHEKQKQWREDNKEIRKEKTKKYREENKEKMAEYQKQYYQINKENKKEYRENNKDKIAKRMKEYKKEYRQKNKDKIDEKITCDICGCESTRNHLTRHQRSAKCQSHKK